MSDTICHKFLETAKKNAQRKAVMFKRGNSWNEMDWASYRNFVSSVAAGLQAIGVRKGDRVAILSNSRLEWAALDIAILGLGAVTVPVYPSTTQEDVAFILADAKVKTFIVETAGAARRLSTVLAQVRTLESVVFLDAGKDDAQDATKLNLPLTSFADLQTMGETALKKSPTLFELAIDETSSQDIATLVYTSGTTGRPKGVLLTHTQALSEVSEAFPLLGVTSRDRSLSFLPYAHVLGRIEIWGHALIGYTMAFAESVDRLKSNLVDVEPTILVAVPRVFEKIYNGILTQADISPTKSRIFKWAIGVGRDISKYKVEKQPVPVDLAIKYQLAKKLVFNKINERLGGKLRFAVCGGAPLSQPIAEFFHAAGLLILEGYGLTETTAAVTVNTPFDYRFGTVGKAFGDVKVKIAADGEILIHSKKVMREYVNDPEATAQAVEEGWFHTGDIGELSAEGYLRITDRKKDLIKTAGGKYVAPQKLEGLLKSNRFISQAHIYGDQRKYVVALLTLNMDAVESFAKDNGVSFKSADDLVQNVKVKELARKAVADANAHLASYESIKNFALLANDFTIESGELTPSLKIKRRVVDKNYHEVLDHLYGQL